jgi:predicted outer membrane repeat protein
VWSLLFILTSQGAELTVGLSAQYDSLAEAVGDAASGDIITVIDNEVLNIDSITVNNKILTIQGEDLAAAETLVLVGAGPMFVLENEATLTLQDFEIELGGLGRLATVDNATLGLNRVNVFDPSNPGANTEDGNAIDADSAQLEIVDSTFVYDSGVPGAVVNGGFIAMADSTLVSSGSDFVGGLAAARGGAIYGMQSSIFLEDMLFSNNQANDGGAVYLDGGISNQDETTLNANTIAFDGNSAASGVAQVRAIHLDSVDISDSWFHGDSTGIGSMALTAAIVDLTGLRIDDGVGAVEVRDALNVRVSAVIWCDHITPALSLSSVDAGLVTNSSSMLPIDDGNSGVPQFLVASDVGNTAGDTFHVQYNTIVGDDFTIVGSIGDGVGDLDVHDNVFAQFTDLTAAGTLLEVDPGSGLTITVQANLGIGIGPDIGWIGAGIFGSGNAMVVDSDDWYTDMGECGTANLAPRPGSVAFAMDVDSMTPDRDRFKGFLGGWDANLFWEDGDEDGWPLMDPTGNCDDVSCRWDCNDDTEQIHPFGDECLGDADTDNNCDGVLEQGGYIDEDGDGFGAGSIVACGISDTHLGGDCNDGTSGGFLHPFADEICNGLDDDCNDVVDDNPAEWIDYYRDGDDDGLPASGVSVPACAPPTDLYMVSTIAWDCNDEDETVGAPDAWLVDDDGDNHYDEDEVYACSGFEDPAWTAADDVPGDHEWDCDDDDELRYPSNDEECDQVDGNCNFDTADTGLLYYEDVDGDGLGAPSDGQGRFCKPPDDLVAASDGEDCDDDDTGVGIASEEVCDGIDNDCDGDIDEGVSSATWGPDSDDDGYADHEQGEDFCDLDLVPQDWVDQFGDCDDTEADVHPGADEACNTVDDDCDGEIDEGDDVDGDDFISDGDCLGVGDDCDDSDAEVHIEAVEICDGIDNNCDGDTDEGLTYPRYEDGDEDGFGFAAIDVCDPTEGVDNASDCDDGNDEINPNAVEVCNSGIDEDCDGLLASCGTGLDEDGDTYCDGEDCKNPADLAGDCDDDNIAINPGAAEQCNGLDDDCDEVVDDGFDKDGDSFFAPCGDDCDDGNALVNPDGFEICNGLDDDCTQGADDGLSEDGDGDGAFTGCAGTDCDDNDPDVGPDEVEVPLNGVDDNCNDEIDEVSTAADEDEDGYCAVGPCLFGALPGDCDDSDPAVNPGAPELPNDGIDNNCDGTKDESADYDGDGFFSDVDDCNDGDPDVNPSAEEQCNGLDDNCDGYVPADERDLDLDGMFECEGDCLPLDGSVRTGFAETCGDGKDNNCNGIVDEDADADDDGYTTCEGDCNDDDIDIHPGVAESCNLIDDNCDAVVDEGFDLDHDGYRICGPCGATNCDCDDFNSFVGPHMPEVCGNGVDDDCNGGIDDDVDADGDGASTCRGDCNDGDPLVNPGQYEFCDGVDNNCDGVVDDGFDEDGDSQSSCAGDCDDDDVYVYWGAPETCDDRDEDCDQLVDEDFSDADGDGFLGCGLDGPDCDDDDASIHPLAFEVCPDGHDNDCNGNVDDCSDTGLPSDDFGVRWIAPTPRCATGGQLSGWFILLLAASQLRRRA